MKMLIVPILLLSFTANGADKFSEEAPELAQKLITSIMQDLNAKIKKAGVAEAVPYCHANIKQIAKSAAGDSLAKYEFGRTSKKIRNTSNRPAPWMEKYLEQFQNNKDLKTLTHTLPDGKRVFMRPLYVQPLCLNCHGENIKPEVEEKISKLYPQDQAKGFRPGDLRGVIWVKEK